MIKDRIKLAIVGCGHISHKHAVAIKEQSGYFDCVALCDPSVESLNNLMPEKDIMRYTSLDELLNHDGLDMVVLCTPSGLHVDQSIQCARKNIHVLCEKPLAVSLNDARDIEKAFELSKADIFIVKQVRYNPRIQFLKQLIDTNEFGDIYHVSLNAYWTRPQDYFDVAKWRGTKALDGGMLLNQMIHFIDMMEWLFGKVSNVSAHTATLARNIETEDVMSSSLRWESGTVGSFNASILSYPKNFETTLIVLGEKGTFKLGGTGLDKLQHLALESERSAPDFDADALSWHGALYGDIANALIKNDLSGAPTLASAIRDIELIEAMHQSSAKGVHVEL